MPKLIESLDHVTDYVEQNGSSLSMRNDINYMCRFNVEKWQHFSLIYAADSYALRGCEMLYYVYEIQFRFLLCISNIIEKWHTPVPWMDDM